MLPSGGFQSYIHTGGKRAKNSHLVPIPRGRWYSGLLVAGHLGAGLAAALFPPLSLAYPGEAQVSIR